MSRTKFLAAALVFAVAVPWIAQTEHGRPGKPAVSVPRPVAAEARANAAPEEKKEQEASLPPGTDPGWWAKVQEYIRQDEYTLAWRDADLAKGAEAGWAAFNRAQGFSMRFTETGFVTTPAKEGACWTWGLSLSAWGRPGAMQPAVKAALHADKNCLDASRPGIGEWFVNDESGLEQGFRIQTPPVDRNPSVSSGRVDSSPLAAGERPPMLGGIEPMVDNNKTLSTLHIDLSLSGTLHPKLAEDGQAVDFYDNGNVSMIRYAQLKATDATGRVLPARFEGAPGAIRISIDDSGAVYPITVDPLATSPAWTAVGENAKDYFGWSVATAGDVNGDGYSDVIVGAWQYISASDAGKVYLYLGGPAGLSILPSWTATGPGGSGFGYSVATAGDVNGDGYSDVIVDGSTGTLGQAYVYYGGPSGLSATPSWTATGETANFGVCVATAGDVNGDGYSDVIIGEYDYKAGSATDTGKAFVYLGGPSGLSSTASWTAVGEAMNNYFGWFVATAGDVNGDGYSDVLVGARGFSTNTGKAYLFLGSASMSGTHPATDAAWTATGEAPANSFGYCLATAGDVNGDGYSDVIVGAYGYNPGSAAATGKAYLYLGGPSGLSSTVSWFAVGEATNNSFGRSVATAGDVNGDGYSDVLVGAYGYNTDRGKAYLYMGGPSGLSGTASWTAVGGATDDAFGFCVATAGDVNGDGFSDVVVGAYTCNSGAGKAYLYLGGGSGPSSTSSWTAAGAATGDQFGFSVATAGDVNGDGYSDVVVGAPSSSGSPGKAYIFLGGPSGFSTTPSWTAAGEYPYDFFGYSVATAGDVNGDGYSDVIVGAPYNNLGTGKAYLYLGGPSGPSTTASWTAVGENQSDDFGYTVGTAGDVNGDGYSDVIVGAPWNISSTGKAYLYIGSPTGLSGAASWTASGETTYNLFGHSIATAGDVNGDGYSDVVVGAYGYSSSMGKAYLYMGGPSGLSATSSWTATGQNAGDEFGLSVATAGDVNGDGYSDVVVGAPYYSGEKGMAYLYVGGSSGLSTTASWTATGEATSNYFGNSVATAGDVNGDGYSDVVVGAYGYNPGSAVNTGRAYVYLGSASGLSSTASWAAAGAATGNYFGYCVAAAGDVNGDGYSDVVVGAYGNSSSTGKAYLYYGNGGPSITLKPQQLRADGSAPIAPLGRAGDGLFKLSSVGRTPFGRGQVKLEWQAAPLGFFYPAGTPFQTTASWLDSGTTGTTLSGTDTLLFEAPYVWRMRAKYRMSSSPFQTHGPWLTLAANGLYETDLRRAPACVLPDEPCWLYSVVKVDTVWTLNWQDPNQADQRTGWNIRRSNNPALPKSTWPLVGSNVVDMDQGTPNYQWTDHSGDDPGPGGVWYYEVTTYNSYCPAEGPF